MGPLTAGAAVVSANVPIGVLAIFTIFDNQGRFVTEAGIADSPLLSPFTLPVEVTPDFSTGVAFFVPGTTAVDLTIRQLDADGVLVRTADTVTLGGKRKIARFAAEFFQGLTSFRGSFSILASGPVAILILRQNAVPLSFTTLQAAPGAVAGAPDLSISKTDGGASFTVGSNRSYTIAVRNAGSRPTTGTITVTDNLPTGLSFVSATGTGWSCSVSGQIVTCAHSGPFAANATSNIALTVAVGSGAIPSVNNTGRTSSAASRRVRRSIQQGCSTLQVVQDAFGEVEAVEFWRMVWYVHPVQQISSRTGYHTLIAAMELERHSAPFGVDAILVSTPKTRQRAALGSCTLGSVRGRSIIGYGEPKRARGRKRRIQTGDT